MLSPQTLWQQRQHTPFLLGIDTPTWVARTQGRIATLLNHPIPHPTLLLNQSDPLEFLASFLAACLTQSPVFLGNPHWTATQWQQALELAQPHLIWSDTPNRLPQSSTPTSAPPGWIMIPTGGSSGTLRFAIHTWSTLLASVQGFQRHFQLDTINACCVLPLYHVSGLMQFMRTFITGGQLAILPFRTLQGDSPPDPALAAFLHPTSQLPQDFCLSLVPTQLQRLYQSPERLPWLARFHSILLGGAPPWPQLLETARQHQLRLAPTYGMTETASQIVTLHPDLFLQGHTSSGQVLPHAQITIQTDGTLAIQAESLCLGYYPHLFPPNQAFVTDDIGYFDAHHELQIVGRRSRKIISGGENIYPEAIEAAFRATQLVTDITILGIPDPEWGEAVTAVYVTTTPDLDPAHLRSALQDHINRYQLPKHWIAVEALPRTAQGKIDPHRLRALIATFV